MPSFCASCGAGLADGDQFCRTCGRNISAPPAPVSAAPLPLGVVPQTSGKAIGSLVCGLLFFIPFAFLAAVVLGHMALSEIRKSAGRLKGEGLAMAGLILGYIPVAAIPIILIIAAIAIPNLLRARQAANESSAVASLRTLNTAEVSYSTEHEAVGFTCSLGELSPPIDGTLASGRRSGYEFKLSNCKADAKGTIVSYHLFAYPVVPNQTGVRAFCTDESAVIRVDASGSARNCLEMGKPLE